AGEEEPGESSEAERGAYNQAHLTEYSCRTERLSAGWGAPIYAFYSPVPRIGYEGSRRYHAFGCAAKGCKQEVRRYLDGKDTASTGNMTRHARKCWGDEAVNSAKEFKTASAARDGLTAKLPGQSRSGTITESFKRLEKGSVTYSHRQHTSTQTRAEIVRWCAESGRPFSIVKDRGFLSLMKTRRPGYYLPSIATVS
ncbi:hypothetical protein AURDEDRAFT_46315, partial [Auricularia subglabra TFB-10046 SS5]